MKRFKKNESIELDLKALKAYANKALPAGDSAAFSMDSNGLLMMEIYDGDVMVMTFPMDVSTDEDAKARIDSKLKGFENG